MRRRWPDFLHFVNLRYVKLGYHYLASNAVYFLVVPVLLVVFSAEVPTLRRNDLWRFWEHPNLDLVSLLYVSGLIGFIACVYYMSSPRSIYLVDFACYKPSDEFGATRDYFIYISRNTGQFDESSLEFQEKAMERSGLGNNTYLPGGILASVPRLTLKEARAEAEMVMFSALDELFDKCKVRPKDIDILVANCSLFSPTPSLSDMIVNHYKMRDNILSFNLSGMGCSAGIIALGLAKDMLQAHGNSYAVVVITENITLNWYRGNNISMLGPNCFFRMGGAAILLSNKRKDIRRSKYQLLHVVRTHTGQDDRSYKSVFQEEDEKGNTGMAISNDLMAIARHAMEANITNLGSLVLPLSEKILFFLRLFSRKVLKMDVKPYNPDFKLAFEHFSVHAGGSAVLHKLQKNLSLSDRHMEPSRMTLHRFGNTGNSSIWYVLAYMEAKKRIRKGEKVWQFAFGSGFICNSAVWKSLRTTKNVAKNPWLDCIDNYPVEIPALPYVNGMLKW